MKSRTITFAAALLSLTGGIATESCTTASDENNSNNETQNDANSDVAAYETLPEQHINANQDDKDWMAAAVKRYQDGQNDPVESKVYEKKNADGTTEQYVLLNVPASKVNVYADNQDSVKSAKNRQVFQQLDGNKVDTVATDNTGRSGSHYHSTPVFVRYYPYNYAHYYSTPSANYNGYYTDVGMPRHSVTEQSYFHNDFKAKAGKPAQTFARSARMGGMKANATQVTKGMRMSTKVTSAMLKTARGVTPKFGVKAGRAGSPGITRGTFGRSALRASS